MTRLSPEREKEIRAQCPNNSREDYICHSCGEIRELFAEIDCLRKQIEEFHADRDEWEEK